MSAAAGIRFAPGPFKYNGRVAAALVPSLLVAAGLGGHGVMGIFTIGTMLWYIMDAMQYREGAFSVGWGTLLLAQAGIVLNLLYTAISRPLMLTVLLMLVCGALMMVTGMWLTLQFRFIQMQYPAVVLAFERQVLTASLPVAAIMQTVGIAAFSDLDDVPYYLCAVMCGMYHVLGQPLESSFHQQPKTARAIGGGGAAAGPPKEAVVQSKVDSFILALFVLVAPATCYLAIHASVINHWMHFWSLLILGTAPLLYLCAIPQGLWWVPMPPRLITGLSRLLMVLAAFGLLAGFEGRVVFYAFSSFIKVPAPWNYVMVTGALFGGVCLCLAHLTGALGTALDVPLAAACLLLCTVAGSLAVGIPFPWIAAPIVAAGGLALYYDSRSLREYGVFVLGVLFTAGWFVHQHFWFLDIRVGFVHLHTICKLAMAALLPAAAVPGLLLAGAGRQWVGVLMLVQAELLAVLEEQMFGAHHHEEAGSEAMYPAYLVIATSVAGIAACQALDRMWAMPRWATWVVSTLYVAKLSMLVLPEAYLVLPTAVLLLAAGAPLYMYEQPEAGRRRTRLQPWQGALHVLSTLVAVALARFAVFDVVQWAMLGRPHEGVLLGALLVVTAAALAPLVMTCYAYNQAAVRLVLMVGVSGLVLATLQPPLPRIGGAACPQLPFALCPRLWDERHVPMHDADDAAVWGSGLGRREHWPRWLLMSAAAVGLVGLSGVVPGSRSPLVRLAVAAAVGWLVGDYMALELVPGQAVLQVLVIFTSMVVVAFVTLLQNPVLGSPTWLPLLGVCWAVALVVTMLLQASLPLPDIQRLQERDWGLLSCIVIGVEVGRFIGIGRFIGSKGPCRFGAYIWFRRLYPDSSLRVEAARMEAAQVALLGVFASHALLMAFALKLKMSAALRQPDKSSRQPGAPGVAPGGYAAADAYARSHKAMQSADFFCGIVPGSVLSQLGKAMNLEGVAGLAMKRLSREGLSWVPTAGNICTLLAFGIALYINHYLTEGAPEPLLLLCPLLLLLSQDPILLRHLGERQRYLPPVLAFSGYLAITSAIQIVTWAVSFGEWAALILNGGMLLLCLPVHIMFVKYLWDQQAQPVLLLVVLGALALVPLFVAQSEGVQYLSASAVVMVLLQFFSMSHNKRVGMKVV